MNWKPFGPLCAHARPDRPRPRRPKVRPEVPRLETRRLMAVVSGITEYPTTSVRSQPIDAVAGSDGNLWVTEYSAKLLAAITPTGTIARTVAVSGNPYGITTTPDGTLWFTENGPTPFIGKVSPNGTGLTEFPLAPGALPHGIALGPDGNLWFAEYGASEVGRITPAGSITLFPLSSGSFPEDIVAGVDGNLWVTESVGDRIARVSPGGGITEFAVPTQFAVPWDITLGPDGNLWFTESGASQIGRITTDGLIREFVIPAADNSRPTDIVTGPDGNLWFTGCSANDVGEISPDCFMITMYPVPTPSSIPTGIAVGPDGSIWATETRFGQVAKLPWLAGGASISLDPTDSQYVSFGTGTIAPSDGDQQTTIETSLRCGCGCGTDASNNLGSPLNLVDNSDTVAPRPIVQTSFSTDPNGPVPTQIQVSLTWNGVTQPTQTFSTTGHKPGDDYLLSVQAPPVTATGVYTWQVVVQVTLPSGDVIQRTICGTSNVVVNGPSDPFGPGWSVSGVDQLVPDGSGGFLWVYGGGGSRDFQAGTGNTFLSPPNDFGTLVQNPDGSFTYTAKDQTRENFDGQGRETSLVDPHGLAVTFTYDSAGRLTQLAEPDGSVATFAYDSTGHLATITETGGRVFTFTYDSAGDMTGVTDPADNPRTFTYDSAGRLTNDSWGSRSTTYTYDPGTGSLSGANEGQGGTLGLVPQSSQGLQTSPALSASQGVAVVTDALNQLTTYTYDSSGRETRVQTPDGGTETYQRDFAGQVIADTDPLGHTTSYTYEYGPGKGDLTQVTYPDNTTTRYQYDPTFHEVTQVQDPLGNLTTYTYDPATGDLLTVQDALHGVTTYVWSDGLLQSVTDSLGHITAYQYDSMRMVQSETDAVGTPVQRTTTYSYDAAGNQISIEDANGHVTSYAYDGMRNVIAETDAVGTPVQRTTTYTYDAQGDVTSVTDPLGHVTSFVYDGRGLLTSETDAVGTPLQRTTTYTYDPLGRLSTVTDADNHTTSYGYDAVGRRTQVTEAVGTPVQRTTTTVYDLDGNVVAAIDPLGHQTTYTYDVRNRQVTVTDPLLHTTTTVYDADGNVIATIDPLGFRTSYTYDPLNRRTSVQEPDGGITTTVYDADSNVINTIDPLGHTTTNVYDALNRKAQVIDPLGGTTTYLYDAVDNLTGLIDPSGNRTTFVYDPLNRVVSETDPLNHTATFAYDALDNLTSTTDRDGRVRNFTYDALDRLSTQTWLDSGGHVVNTLTYTYDPVGNLLTAGDVNGTYTFTYDALNRAVTVQEPFGVSLTYVYDADNNRTLMQDSFGGVTTSVYDADNELISRQFDGTGQTPLRFDMTYDPRGNLATETRFSDLAGTHVVGTSSYTYNGDGEVTNLLQQDGSGTALANYTYTYDLADRVLTETLNGSTTTYTYDNTSQVTGATSPVITTSYSYDASGNRTNPGYSTDGANELLTDGIWNFSYDAEGNLIGKVGISNGLSWTYTYDNLNRLTSAQEFSGATLLQTVTYRYDVFGNRIEEDVTAGATTTVTRFAYDGQHVWADLDGSNHLLTRRLYLDAVDQLVARISASGVVAWYLTDTLGSVRALTDASGAVQDQITYDAFGNVVSETNPSFGDRYKFTGREFDAATGLQYNRARYYDPTIGRWTSQDPLGVAAGDPNLYRYVFNDPVNLVDPLGLQQQQNPADVARDRINMMRNNVQNAQDVKQQAQQGFLRTLADVERVAKALKAQPKGGLLAVGLVANGTTTIGVSVECGFKPGTMVTITLNTRGNPMMTITLDAKGKGTAFFSIPGQLKSGLYKADAVGTANNNQKQTGTYDGILIQGGR